MLRAHRLSFFYCYSNVVEKCVTHASRTERAAPLLPHHWGRCRSMPRSASLHQPAASGAALGFASQHVEGEMVFRGGSVTSAAAVSKTAPGKERRGRSSLGSKCYSRSSTVISGELAPPRFWLCQDQDPNLNLAKSTGRGPGQDKRGSCSGVTSPPPPLWPQNHGAESQTCSTWHPRPHGLFPLGWPRSISFSPRTFPGPCQRLSVSEVGRRAQRVKEMVAGSGCVGPVLLTAGVVPLM